MQLRCGAVRWTAYRRNMLRQVRAGFRRVAVRSKGNSENVPNLHVKDLKCSIAYSYNTQLGYIIDLLLVM